MISAAVHGAHTRFVLASWCSDLGGTRDYSRANVIIPSAPAVRYSSTSRPVSAVFLPACLIRVSSENCARWPNCFANPLDMNHLRPVDSDTDNAGQDRVHGVDWEIG
jgi:hypothetical protein